jgi:hypothetical protein
MILGKKAKGDKLSFLSGPQLIWTMLATYFLSLANFVNN